MGGRGALKRSGALDETTLRTPDHTQRREITTRREKAAIATRHWEIMRLSTKLWTHDKPHTAELAHDRPDRRLSTTLRSHDRSNAAASVPLLDHGCSQPENPAPLAQNGAHWTIANAMATKYARASRKLLRGETDLSRALSQRAVGNGTLCATYSLTYNDLHDVPDISPYSPNSRALTCPCS